MEKSTRRPRRTRPARPRSAELFGSPEDECGQFGLTVIGKWEMDTKTTTFVAPKDAYVAIIESGRGTCDKGENAYRITVNVTKGQVLSTPVDQGISHVTLCACPK